MIAPTYSLSISKKKSGTDLSQFMYLGAVASDILNLCIEARKGAFGPFSPSFDINKHLLGCLHNNLPDNVHKIVKYFNFFFHLC